MTTLDRIGAYLAENRARIFEGDGSPAAVQSAVAAEIVKLAPKFWHVTSVAFDRETQQIAVELRDRNGLAVTYGVNFGPPVPRTP